MAAPPVVFARAGCHQARSAARRGALWSAHGDLNPAQRSSQLAAWPPASCTCNGICAGAWVEHDRPRSSSGIPAPPGEQALGNLALARPGCRCGRSGDREFIKLGCSGRCNVQVHRLNRPWHRRGSGETGPAAPRLPPPAHRLFHPAVGAQSRIRIRRCRASILLRAPPDFDHGR